MEHYTAPPCTRCSLHHAAEAASFSADHSPWWTVACPHHHQLVAATIETASLLSSLYADCLQCSVTVMCHVYHCCHHEEWSCSLNTAADVSWDCPSQLNWKWRSHYLLAGWFRVQITVIQGVLWPVCSSYHLAISISPVQNIANLRINHVNEASVQSTYYYCLFRNHI